MDDFLTFFGVGYGFAEVMMAGAFVGMICAISFIGSYFLMTSGIKKLSVALKTRKALSTYRKKY